VAYFNFKYSLLHVIEYLNQVVALFFLNDIMVGPPSWNYDVIWHRKTDSVNRCVFTWRAILPNFIPIRFETKEL